MWYTSRFFTVLVHACTKSRIKQDMQKTLCSRISRISALGYYVGCIDMNIYRYILTEGRNWAEEFQNILERKLCNCFGQLLVMHYENVEHGIEHINSAYRVCIH